MPKIMEKEAVEDLDVIALQYIAKHKSIRNNKTTRDAIERLAKFSENMLYKKALVWAMIRSLRVPNDTEGLNGITLLVAAVLSTEGNNFENLLERFAKETNERIHFALNHEAALLNIVCDFLEVNTIDDNHWRQAVHQFFVRNNETGNDRVWHTPAVILYQWKTGVEGQEGVETILKAYLDSQALAERLTPLAIAADFVSTAVAMIDNPVPLVHAIAVERMGLKLRIDSPLFLIQVLYCFAFHQKNANSPFCFNPRNLPLRQLIRVADSLLWGDDLVAYIDAACPEVKQISRQFSSCLVVDANKLIQMKKILLDIVRKSVRDIDDEGEQAETVFLEAATVLSDADLISTTVSALMAKQGSPPPFMTYSILYNDPICILKCPLRIWNRASFRRLLLTILKLLMQVNTAVVERNARTPELAKEYIVSRDLVLLRCLVGVATSDVTSSACQSCDVLISHVRKIVVEHAGLVAALVRQDQSEEILDCLVQWVPETFCDGLRLQRFLCDKTHWVSSSTRLKAADFSVRVAVAHGHRSPKVSSTMVATALSMLLSSFFLILGPVGVSVDAARGGGDGTVDATNTCRAMAFRLLRATQRIRIYRKMVKAEIIPVLQKLMGMCKGELIVGSLPSSVTGKQKAFLKEFGDAVAKTLDVLGPG